ncbi:MAG: hypothetical protein COB81_11105 [Flavobacteriaceae bacterium]|nr:MAG: hypothetical protein COB81_11105 [Flavobacteriaceae bacterium]
MKHTFKICTKNKLILRKMRGDITLDDYKNLLIEARNIEGYNSNYRVILDYRDSNLVSNIREYISYLKLFQKDDYHNNTKLFIASSPRVFVACNLFKDIVGYKNAFIFSSPLAALQHLGLQDTPALQFLETD